MYCKKCGADNPEGAMFCRKCGYEIAFQKKAPARGEPEPIRRQVRKPEPGTLRTMSTPSWSASAPMWGSAEIPETEDDYDEDHPLSMWGYFGFSLLFGIPVIGWILAVVLSCGVSGNTHLTSFARGILIRILFILIVLLGTFLALSAWVRSQGYTDVLRYFVEELEKFLGTLYSGGS